MNVVANFDLLTYTLNINTTGDGSGSVDREPNQATYDYGTLITLTANANAGSSFNEWRGDLIGASNPVTLTIQGTTSITASFALIPPQTYNLVVNVLGQGIVTPTSGTYISGTLVSLSAAAHSGWQFVGWSGGLTSPTAPISLTMASDKVITATFTQIPTYTLTVNTGGDGSGSVLLDPSGGIYEQGTVVTLTASSDSGSVFSGWAGSLMIGTNPVSLTMDSDKTVTAIFTTIPSYTLSINITGSGTITPASGSYLSGTLLSLSATPNAGWQFAGWSGDLISTTTPISLSMAGDKIITATFTMIDDGQKIFLPLVLK